MDGNADLRHTRGVTSKTILQRRPPIRVPRKYSGQWIAWSHDRTRIVASGRTYEDAREAAVAAGEPQAFLTRAPDAEVRFVGAP